MEDVAGRMDQGRASLQAVMEHAAGLSQELRDAPAAVRVMEEHLQAALAIAERLAPLLGYHTVQPALTDLEEAAESYGGAFEGSVEQELFQAGIATIEGHLKVPAATVGMKRIGLDIAGILRKTRGMDDGIATAKEAYDHATGASELLLKVDNAYRTDKGLPPGE